jgi:diguanylate cyclase (GGDEF)-like protein
MADHEIDTDAAQSEALARMADENALLRAALAEMRGRLGELEESNDSDPLTGLPNARAFHRELNRVVSHANRHDVPAALLSIDLAGLGEINQRHGQLAGDAALSHTARLLQGLIRTSDVAARLGGSHFALILDHLDSDSAIDTGDRIGRYLAENPLDIGGATVALRANVAVASILKGDTADDVQKRAARNLERLKDF